MSARPRRPTVRSDPAELALLYEISRILDRSIDLRDVMNPVLRAMARHMGMLRGTITLLDRETGEISIEAAYGLSERQKRRGRYRLGEGVTGKVIQTGRPAVVPRVSEEPLFLNRTGARRLSKREISFICVPIKVRDEVIGALSADRMFEEEVSLDEDVRILSIIASMIAQAVSLRRAALEERNRLMQENIRLKQALQDRFHPANIVGNSRAMQEVYELIKIVSQTDTTVLIRGESGTGKELVAQAIHYNSRRADGPLVKVNCAALPESVIESELFGHEKGAFTGAHTTRKGRFELASGGTIFLDEIGDLSPATQIRLLRVLQEREFERVGGTETIKVDVRVIAATNADLEARVSRGLFRKDLYFRLNVVPIHLPPLRERREDIPLLVYTFIRRFAERNRKDVQEITPEALQRLMAYHWPGNVRELENCIERMVVVANKRVLDVGDIPPEILPEATGPTANFPVGLTMKQIEEQAIRQTLAATGGNRKEAARILGIGLRTLHRKIEQYGISRIRRRK